MSTFSVLIPAAGSGTRLGADRPKQYLPLLGMPVLLHTLAVFDAIEDCASVVIASDDPSTVQALLATRGWRVSVQVVPGGARRQDSVANALAALPDDDGIVLIHDAARPCVEADHVRAVAETVRRHGAALLAIPARDTIKHVQDDVVCHTVPRSALWLAQTPQGATAARLREAFAHARAHGIEATDDVELLERIGVRVHVVRGSAGNLKITEALDLVLAEALLRAQGRNA
jgi:2-C-methyl-D-erythritol 4-phosphate cytidylyltransferase